ncbi:MAG: hypothetical protein SFV22_18965, partial [Saprospiraceae bacterium]|nr:hypothetical protein [Saprospiraceae bacterium]
MSRFLNYSLIFICLLLAGNFQAAPLPADDDPVLTVNISDGGNASMSWTAFGTSGAYTVTVNDLTTGR